MSPRYGLHICTMSKTCREFGAPPRLYLHTPRRHIGIALTRDARYTDARLVNGQIRVGRSHWIDHRTTDVRQDGNA